MTDRELAEKVAEKLGRSMFETNSCLYIYQKPIGLPTQSAWDYLTQNPEEFIQFISWPTFGLMIEDTEKRGWRINILRDYICFYNFEKMSGSTPEYLTTEHGHIKACAYAFLGTFDD